MAGFADKDIQFPHEEDGTNAEERFMSLLTNPDIDWGSGNIQCILTYQSLVRIVRKNPSMAGFIRERFGVVIEDEAHRGLGYRTKSATNAITEELGMDEDELEELRMEEEAEEIIGSADTMFHYYFTATPNLILKSLSEEDEYITFATVEEAVRTGAIVLPQCVDIGKAFLKTESVNEWKETDIERFAENDEFVDENGIPIKDTIISAYKEKFALHEGKLPAVAFASTIEHARQITEDLRKEGIRAERITSSTKDMHPSDAIALMEKNKLDVIVTVMKVSEGFDYPPLSCSLWFTPSVSPMKITQ